ncbi:MAG: archaemetzincin [Desulfurococcales archaeon]|nr:archaemetzincin [Desulfurococcales archaeon]
MVETMTIIILQSINKSFMYEIVYLKDAIINAMPGPIQVVTPGSVLMLPLDLYNTSRMQYNAENVNRYLYSKYSNILRSPGVYLIGIVNGDGYVNNLNFVFGLATPRLRVATIYSKRIIDYANHGLYLERLLKLILHEFGHLAGLTHCRNQCVMRYSNSLEELDEKPPYYCQVCMDKLRKTLAG